MITKKSSIWFYSKRNSNWNEWLDSLFYNKWNNWQNVSFDKNNWQNVLVRCLFFAQDINQRRQQHKVGLPL